MAKKIDLSSKTKAELDRLGCRAWDGEGLMLVPKDLLPDLAEGQKLYCIDGGEVVVGRDYVDGDTRFGLLAYGVYPKGSKKPAKKKARK